MTGLLVSTHKRYASVSGGRMHDLTHEKKATSLKPCAHISAWRLPGFEMLWACSWFSWLTGGEGAQFEWQYHFFLRMPCGPGPILETVFSTKIDPFPLAPDLSQKPQLGKVLASTGQRWQVTNLNFSPFASIAGL